MNATNDPLPVRRAARRTAGDIVRYAGEIKRAVDAYCLKPNILPAPGEVASWIGKAASAKECLRDLEQILEELLQESERPQRERRKCQHD